MNQQCKTSGMLGLVVAFAIAGGGLSFAVEKKIGSQGNHAKAGEEVLLNANTFIGNTVLDKDGQNLGTVKDLMIDQASGQIAYIILAYGGTFGGTLGINQENYSIPWKDVTLSKKDGAMVIQVAKVPVGESVTTERHASTMHQKDVFNASTLETVEGTVENIDNELFEEGVKMSDSLVVLDVTTASGKERVRIAPDDYLKNQGIEIKEGDKVKIVGSRVNDEGESLLLASKLTLSKNGKVLALRQDNGTPNWNHGKEIRAKSKAKN